MSKRKEKISAFLDDDIHRDELMSFSLSAEADDADVARRYQMVGDALRGEMSDVSFVDVSHAVREALADENIADAMSSASTNASDSASTHISTVQSSGFDWSSWFRPLTGMAVAASVAVVMVAVLTEQANDGVSPVATNAEQDSKQQAIQLAVDSPSLGKKSTYNTGMNLGPYINQHLEFATQDTLQGRLPYVRAVGFEPSNRFEPVRLDSVSGGKTEK